MAGVIQLAKKQWMEHLKTEPVRVYFTAVRYGWQEEAQEAAMCAANQAIEDVYVADNRIHVYLRLSSSLEYHHKYRSAVAAITSDPRENKQRGLDCRYVDLVEQESISNKGRTNSRAYADCGADCYSVRLRVLATQFQNSYRNGSYC